MPKTTVHVVDTMVTTPAHVAKASCGQAAELLGRHFTRAKAQYEKMVKLAKSQVVVDASDSIDASTGKQGVTRQSMAKRSEVGTKGFTSVESTVAGAGVQCVVQQREEGRCIGTRGRVCIARGKQLLGSGAVTKGATIGNAVESSVVLGSVPDTVGSLVVGSVQGTVVQGAAQRRNQLVSKKAFRRASKIRDLLPPGSAGLDTKVPRRKDFGEEGEAGDALHAAAMEEFSIRRFGSSHVQQRTIDKRMRDVGLFGFWLEQNSYGKYVQWN